MGIFILEFIYLNVPSPLLFLANESLKKLLKMLTLSIFIFYIIIFAYENS
jgi:hypothetical protein